MKSLSSYIIFKNLRGLTLSFATLLLADTSLVVAASLNVPINRTIETSAVNAGDVVVSQVEDNRSYCCEITSVAPNISNYASLGAFTNTTGALSDQVSRGTSAPWSFYTNQGVDSRRCFKFTEDPSVEGNNGRAIASSVVAFTGAPSGTFSLRCDETTLFGGFNTVVTDFNFIEVTNTLAKTDQNNDVAVSIVARGNKSGTQVLSTSFNLAPGQRFDVDVHSQASDDFGPVVLTHNGPKGAIRAVNAQYRIVSTSPTLDFEPVLVVPFATRD